MSPRVRTIVIGVAILVAAMAALMWLSNRAARETPASAPSPAPAPAPVASAPAADAEPENACPSETGSKVARYGSFEVTLNREDGCNVSVKAGGALLASDETGLAVYVQSVDLDRDGAAELLVVADSGGSSLHSNNYVFTEKPAPRLVEMYDGCATRVRRAPDGRPALETCTLGMNMMDGVCNGCSPRPLVYYMLEGGKLVKRNNLFAAVYDRRIAAEEKDIKPDEAEAFLKSENKEDGAFSNSPTRDAVMRIAADYIYSGRDAKAKEVVEKYWPAWDRERILEDLGAKPVPKP